MRFYGLVVIALLSIQSVFSATTVSDTLYASDGVNRLNGRLEVWVDVPFTSSGKFIPKGMRSITVRNGVVNFQLEPNSGSTPAGTSYRVEYYVDAGTRSIQSDTWVVSATTPATISSIRTTSIPSPSAVITLSQITSAGNSGDTFYTNTDGSIGRLAKGTVNYIYSQGVDHPEWIVASGGGTVTSVAETFVGGLISVAGSPITAAGTFALTVAGTNGGIPYFSSPTTWASSAALTANAVMIGGGAGGAPSTLASNSITGAVLYLSGGTTPAWSGSAGILASNRLDALSATTSAQLLGVISDETGSGALVFGTSPVIITPTITAPTGILVSDISPFGKSTMRFIEEFCFGNTTTASLGELGWTRVFNSVAPTITNLAGETNHPCILRIATSTTNSDLAQLQAPVTTVWYGLGQTAGWKMQYIVRLSTISNGRWFFGVGAAYTTNAIGAWIDSGDGNCDDFFCLYTASASSVTKTTGGSSAAAGTWYSIIVEMTVAGTARMQIDSGSVYSTSTNVPGATITMGPLAVALNASSAATSLTIDYDYVGIWMTGLTR